MSCPMFHPYLQLSLMLRFKWLGRNIPHGVVPLSLHMPSAGLVRNYIFFSNQFWPQDFFFFFNVHTKHWSGGYYKLKRVAKDAETHLPSWEWNAMFHSDCLFAVMRNAKRVGFQYNFRWQILMKRTFYTQNIFRGLCHPVSYSIYVSCLANSQFSIKS